jgi:hypothetical protein
LRDVKSAAQGSRHDRRPAVEPFDLEARDAFVVGGDVFELLLRQYVVDDLVAIRRAFLDELHHLLRPVAAVEHHDVGGRRTWRPQAGNHLKLAMEPIAISGVLQGPSRVPQALPASFAITATICCSCTGFCNGSIR